MKMGIKTGDTVQVIQWHINFLRECLQLVGGQITELSLDVPELVENQEGTSSPGRVFIPSSENNHESRLVLRIRTSAWAKRERSAAVILARIALNKSGQIRLTSIVSESTSKRIRRIFIRCRPVSRCRLCQNENEN